MTYHRSMSSCRQVLYMFKWNWKEVKRDEKKRVHFHSILHHHITSYYSTLAVVMHKTVAVCFQDHLFRRVGWAFIWLHLEAPLGLRIRKLPMPGSWKTQAGFPIVRWLTIPDQQLRLIFVDFESAASDTPSAKPWSRKIAAMGNCYKPIDSQSIIPVPETSNQFQPVIWQFQFHFRAPGQQTRFRDFVGGLELNLVRWVSNGFNVTGEPVLSPQKSSKLRWLNLSPALWSRWHWHKQPSPPQTAPHRSPRRADLYNCRPFRWTATGELFSQRGSPSPE